MTEEKEKKDSKFMMLFILQGITLIALIGLGVFVFLNPAKISPTVNSSALNNKMLAEEIKKKEKKQEVKKEEEVICSLDPFIVNLMDNGGRRYLKVKMDFVLSSKDAQEEIKKKTSEIRDIVIMTLSGKTFNDIASLEGKIRLRDQIKENINKILAFGRVLKIYFTEFVVQ